MKSKKCSGCSEVKYLEEFSKNKNAKDKLQYKCKQCTKQYEDKKRKNYLKPTVSVEKNSCIKCDKTKNISNFRFRNDTGKYSNTCNDCRSERSKKIVSLNREKNKNKDPYKDIQNKICYVCKENKNSINFHKNNSHGDGLCDECTECAKKRVKGNRPAINAKLNKRYNEDLSYRMLVLLRNRISGTIARGYKNSSSTKLLGCTIDELKAHLESKFYTHRKTKEIMTWDNWGKTGWHIDHIIPLSSFDLTNPDQIKQACHYTNLQPLWAEENLRKSAKLDYKIEKDSNNETM